MLIFACQSQGRRHGVISLPCQRLGQSFADWPLRCRGSHSQLHPPLSGIASDQSKLLCMVVHSTLPLLPWSSLHSSPVLPSGLVPCRGDCGGLSVSWCSWSPARPCCEALRPSATPSCAALGPTTAANNKNISNIMDPLPGLSLFFSSFLLHEPSMSIS
jgi:hypothetical protein